MTEQPPFVVWSQPIAVVDDALRLVEASYERQVRAFLLDHSVLPPEFFDLRTRFAGEFVQKVVNYGLRVAAVFPPDPGHGERFREFVGELRGGHAFRTFETRADAEAWLASS